MSTELMQTTLQRLPTWGDFITICSPANLCRQYSKVTRIYHSIERSRISLKEISEAYPQTDGVPAGMLYVKTWIEYFNEFSNINKPLPHTQINNVSVMLYTKYLHFYLSDLKLILEWILEGRYGKFYGSVDSQLILSAFYEYNNELEKILYESNSKKEVNVESKDILKLSLLSTEEIDNLLPTFTAWKKNKNIDI